MFDASESKHLVTNGDKTGYDHKNKHKRKQRYQNPKYHRRELIHVNTPKRPQP